MMKTRENSLYCPHGTFWYHCFACIDEKHKVEIAELEAECREFIWAEDNPKQWESLEKENKRLREIEVLAQDVVDADNGNYENLHIPLDNLKAALQETE